jgi:transcriptional regulator with XRE-family HTH domain
VRLRNRVRATRALRGITQSALAEWAGISRMTLRRVERDDGYVPWGTVMVALANALDDEGLWWMERDGNEKRIAS